MSKAQSKKKVIKKKKSKPVGQAVLSAVHSKERYRSTDVNQDTTILPELGSLASAQRFSLENLTKDISLRGSAESKLENLPSRSNNHSQKQSFVDSLRRTNDYKARRDMTLSSSQNKLADQMYLAYDKALTGTSLGSQNVHRTSLLSPLPVSHTAPTLPTECSLKAKAVSKKTAERAKALASA